MFLAFNWRSVIKYTKNPQIYNKTVTYGRGAKFFHFRFKCFFSLVTSQFSLRKLHYQPQVNVHVMQQYTDCQNVAINMS